MGPQNMQAATPGAQDSAGDGLRHSRELANQLVRHLGVQGATQTCLENHWQGVLDIIRAMNQKQ